MPHKIGIYVRVSTEEQAQVADGSIDSQQHRIKSFIDVKLHQEPHWGKVIDTYIDDGYSAGSTNRPAYQRMIRDIKHGKIDLILVADLSRLTRNIPDFCELHKELGKFKASFLSIKEQFDTSTSIGEMMVFMMINLAQFERKQTSERISMNFHSRAMRGLANGGRPILGYDRDPLNAGRRNVNPVEAELVKRIFDMYNDGESLSSIADQLTKESVKRKENPSTRNRHISEGRWTIDCLQTILRNYAYIGIREVNAMNKGKDVARLKAWQQYQLVPATWSAIIDEKVFSKVQVRLEEARLAERKRFDNGERRTFLLSGMIRCAHCGRALTGQSAHGSVQVHRYYGHKQVIGEKITCPVKRFSANEIEDAVIQHLDKVLNEHGYLEKIEATVEHGQGNEQKALKTQKDSVMDSINKVDGEIESVFKLVSTMNTGSAGELLIQERLQKLAEKKKALRQELDNLNQFVQNEPTVSGVKKFIESNIKAVKLAFRKAKPNLQKKLLRSVYKQLTASDLGIGIHYRFEEEPILIGNEAQMKKPSGKTLDGLISDVRLRMTQNLHNLAFGCSPVVGIGRHPSATCNLSQIHDFIEISIHLISHENTDFKAFYEQGHSINEIADRLGFPYSTVRDQLVRLGVTLRTNKSVSFSGNQRQTFKNSAPPPYGYCYLEGRLQKDPREYPILQMIEKQRQLGHTPTEIARFLSGKGFKTRHGKSWSQAHVFNIVQKLKTKKLSLQLKGANT